MGPQPGQNEADDEAARLKQAKEQLQLARNKDRSNEEAMHEDGLFLVGGRNQWDEGAIRERVIDGRPIPTHNLFTPLLAQITGEIRRNRPAIKCAPGDALATPETAKVFEGIIRSIERLSQANRVYARVGKAASGVGKGHMRIVPVYADDESFDIELRIRPIKNVYSVKWDPAAQQDDKGDANWCYVVSELDRKSFEQAYPTVGAAAWAKATAAQRRIDGWRSGDTVTVAEQWVVKKEPFERYRVAHTRSGYSGLMMIAPTGQEVELDGDVGADTIDGIPAADFLQQMEGEGWEVVQSRTAYKKKICMCLWGGDKQIAGPIEWKGARIPIFTCVGEEIDVGEDTVEHGIVRHAKDDQRSYNYSRAAMMELVSQAPKAPILVADDQLDGYEDEWILSQRKPVPYLRYKHINGLSAPNERSGPQANSGPSELADRAMVGIKDTTGIQDAAVGKKSNETSGVAIQERDAQVDTGTYVYLDNLNSTIESLGTELVNAIPHYYSARKQIMILGEDDAPAIIDLAQQGIDLQMGKYHVIAQRGPSYQTRREKAADQLIEMSRAAPPWAQPIIFKRVAKLTEMEDADDFIAELQATGEMMGQLPPMNGAPPGMPGMPGAPPMQAGPQGPLPPNVIPMPQRGGPPQADPLAGVAPSSPPGVPAPRTRVGPPMGAPPGM